MERVQGDTSAVQGVWQIFITGAGAITVALVSLFSVALSIDPMWTLGAVIGATDPDPAGRDGAALHPTQDRQMREQSSDRSTRLDEVFHGIASVKLNGIEEYQPTDLARWSAESASRCSRSRRCRARFRR